MSEVNPKEIQSLLKPSSNNNLKNGVSSPIEPKEDEAQTHSDTSSSRSTNAISATGNNEESIHSIATKSEKKNIVDAIMSIEGLSLNNNSSNSGSISGTTANNNTSTTNTTNNNNNNRKVYTGFLSKEGSKWKTWKYRFFEIFENGDILYKKTEDDKEFLRKFNISGCRFAETIEKGKPFCLKIVKRDSNLFFICANNTSEFNALKASLLSIGLKAVQESELSGNQHQSSRGGVAILGDSRAVGSNSTLGQRPRRYKQREKTSIESIDVDNWSIDEVTQWLNCVLLRFQRSEQANAIAELFKVSKMTGPQLLKLSLDDLKGFGLKSMGQRAHVKEEIEKLQQNRYFDSKQQSIYLKFSKIDMSNNKFVRMGNWVESLCDEKLIKQTYLSPNLEILPSSEEELISTEDLADIRMFGQSAMKQTSYKLRVKLVITEICHSSLDKALRMILSPIISKIPSVSSGEFGLFHTALIIGPFYLEWTDSSLCVPKKMVSSMALLSADIDELAVKKESLEEIIEKIAAVVVDWNMNYLYCKSSASKTTNNVLASIPSTLTNSSSTTNVIPTEEKLEGNCFAKGTQVLVIDSPTGGFCNRTSSITGNGNGVCDDGNKTIRNHISVRKIEDIKVGDLVLGPDSKPREVYRLVNGKAKLFNVMATGNGNGNDNGRLEPCYVCNGSHLLVLKTERVNMDTGELSVSSWTCSVEEYLKQPAQIRDATYQEWAPILFESKLFESRCREAGIDLKFKTKVAWLLGWSSYRRNCVDSQKSHRNYTLRGDVSNSRRNVIGGDEQLKCRLQRWISCFKCLIQTLCPGSSLSNSWNNVNCPGGVNQQVPSRNGQSNLFPDFGIIDIEPHLADLITGSGVFPSEHNLLLPDWLRFDEIAIREWFIAGFMDASSYYSDDINPNIQRESDDISIWTKEYEMGKALQLLGRSLGIDSRISHDSSGHSDDVDDQHHLKQMQFVNCRISFVLSAELENILCKCASSFHAADLPLSVPLRKPTRMYFCIEPVQQQQPIGEYYGFSVHGPNQLFLLANSAVVHNCQDFVDDILGAIGVSTRFDGALGDFVKEMRNKGTSKIQFTATKAFREIFQLKKSSYDFPTHKDLDEFVSSLLAIEPLFKSKFSSEYALLKSFDRAFWLRHFKSPEDERMQPLFNDNYKTNTRISGRVGDFQMCPFDNPRSTKSMF